MCSGARGNVGLALLAGLSSAGMLLQGCREWQAVGRLGRLCRVQMVRDTAARVSRGWDRGAGVQCAGGCVGRMWLWVTCGCGSHAAAFGVFGGMQLEGLLAGCECCLV
jgi:hypothetical protein